MKSTFLMCLTSSVMGAIIAVYFVGNWPQNLASASPSPTFNTAESSAQPEYATVGSSALQ